MKHALLIAYLAGCLITTARQIDVWRDNLTLFARAVQESPYKPRPAMIYGRLLIRAGHKQAGAEMMSHAYKLSRADHVPAWDKAKAESFVVLVGKK